MGMCAGVRRCVRVCAGVHKCARVYRVCAGMHGCSVGGCGCGREYAGVWGGAQVCVIVRGCL